MSSRSRKPMCHFDVTRDIGLGLVFAPRGAGVCVGSTAHERNRVAVWARAESATRQGEDGNGGRSAAAQSRCAVCSPPFRRGNFGGGFGRSWRRVAKQRERFL